MQSMLKTLSLLRRQMSFTMNPKTPMSTTSNIAKYHMIQMLSEHRLTLELALPSLETRQYYMTIDLSPRPIHVRFGSNRRQKDLMRLQLGTVTCMSRLQMRLDINRYVHSITR